MCLRPSVRSPSRAAGAQVEEVLAGGGVEADDGDFHGRTALHLAASNGHLATVRRLVLGGAPLCCTTGPASSACAAFHSNCSITLRLAFKETRMPCCK